MKASVLYGSSTEQPAAGIRHGSSFDPERGWTSCNSGGSSSDESFDQWYANYRSTCKRCGVKFTIFNHRHTCRRCDEPVCHACSRNREVLSTYRPPMRVCDRCLARFWLKIGPDAAADKKRGSARVSPAIWALPYCPEHMSTLPTTPPSTPMVEGESSGSPDPSAVRHPEADMTGTTTPVSPRALMSRPENNAGGRAGDEGIVGRSGLEGDLSPSGAATAVAEAAIVEGAETAATSGDASPSPTPGVPDESRPSEPLVVSTNDVQAVEAPSVPMPEEGSAVRPCTDGCDEAVVNEVESAQAVVEETGLYSQAAGSDVCQLPPIDAEGTNGGAVVEVTEEVKTDGPVDTTRVLYSSGVIQTGEVCENKARAGNKCRECQEIPGPERGLRALSTVQHLEGLTQADRTAQHELMESEQAANSNAREYSVTGAGVAEDDMLRARARVTSAGARESRTEPVLVGNTLCLVVGFGLGVAVSCVARMVIASK